MVNLCSILGHSEEEERFSRKIHGGGPGAEGLYQEMLRVKCSRCGKVFKTRPIDYRDH